MRSKRPLNLSINVENNIANYRKISYQLNNRFCLTTRITSLVSLTQRKFWIAFKLCIMSHGKVVTKSSHFFLIFAKAFSQLSVRSNNMEFRRFSFHPSSAYFSVISSSVVLLFILLILTLIFFSCQWCFSTWSTCICEP